MKKKLLGIFVCTLLIGTILSSVSGTELKQYTSISTLNDGNTLYVGGSGLGNYSTIQEAIDNASDGDIVFVYSGTYFENVVVDKSIDLVGENRNTTIIDAENKDNTHTIYIEDVDCVNVTGFTIKGSGLNYVEDGYNYDGIFCGEVQLGYIYDNIICENGNGIRCLGSGSDVFITECEIINNYDNGIRGNSRFFIENNIINYNGNGMGPSIQNGDGIEIMTAALESLIIHNDISHNKIDGIWIETIDNHVIMENTISYNGQSGIHLRDSRGCTIYDNIIHHNGGDISPLTGMQQGGIVLFDSSTRNTIENNTIHDNTIGICSINCFRSSINNNEIYRNTIGIYLRFSFNDNINNNRIYINDLFGLVAIMSFGDASLNWWGNFWGPYTGQILRIPPLTVIVLPWLFFD